MRNGNEITEKLLLYLAVCRFTTESIYPLVTYAIEKRAQKLYPVYQKVLKELGSKVTVMSIIKEEREPNS